MHTPEKPARLFLLASMNCVSDPILDFDKRASATITAILQVSPIATLLLNEAGKILALNSAAEQLIQQAAEQMLDQPFTALLDLSPSERMQSFAELFTVGEENFTCTRKIVRHDRSFEVELVIRHSSESMFIVSIREIDTMTQSHDPALAGSILRTIFENAQEGFILVDENCLIKAISSSEYGKIVLKKDNREIKIGNSIFDYIQDDRQAFFHSVIKRALAGKQVQYERSYSIAGKNDQWFHFSFNPVREHDRISGICITGNNITERKLATQLVEQNEKRFRGLVENSGDAVSIISADYRILYISESIQQMLGYKVKTVTGMELLPFLHPDDHDKAITAIIKVLDNPGKTFPNNTWRCLDAQGSYRWLDCTLTNMFHDPSIGGIVNNFRDITESIEAENLLRQSRESYKYLFDNNPLPMWIYDLETLAFLEVNNTTISQYGYTREEFLSMNLLALSSESDGDRIIKAVTDRKSKDYNEAGSWYQYTKTGEQLFVDIFSHKIKYNGRESILVLANDITEKSKATELLLKSYGEKNDILESITDGFFTINKNWQVAYWNKAAERIFGISRESVLGQDIRGITGLPVPVRFFADALHSIEEKQPFNNEEFFASLNIWIDVTVYPAEDAVSVYFKDITEKKHTLESIRATKERYEMIAKASNEAIYEWDILENVSYWGEGYESLFGHKRSAGKMAVETWSGNLHPDEKDNIIKATTDAFKSGKQSLERELRFRCANGEYKTVCDKLAILYNLQGRAVKIVGAMQDISEKRQLEQELMQAAQRQQREVAEATIRGQENERKQLGIELHDNITQILASARLYLETARSSDQKTMMIEKSRDLITMATSELRKLSHTLLPPSLLTLGLKESLENLTEQIEQAGQLKFVREWQCFDQAMISEDQQLTIYRIVQEQLNNIIKHANAKNVLITLMQIRNCAAIELLVRDDGRGFDPSAKRSGVGLRNIVSRVELYGGKVQIKSSPGQGCDLKVIFPARQ